MNRKSRKRKQTVAELQEEESLLMKERVHLNRELASVHMNLQEQRVRSDSLKKIKFDLNMQSATEMGVAASELDTTTSYRWNQMEVSTTGHAHSSFQRYATHGLASSEHCTTQKEVDPENRRFVLPDLNMMPSEEETGSFYGIS